jgi:hypothetical protein
MEGPKCPGCGSQQFSEAQTVYETQPVSWNEAEGFIEYGSAEFNEVVSVDGIACASCGKDLGAEFFQPWYQDKTRSEIYGERTVDAEKKRVEEIMDMRKKIVDWSCIPINWVCKLGYERLLKSLKLGQRDNTSGF